MCVDEANFFQGMVLQFFFLSPKPHILDINEVWYSSFWSEGPKNLKILISKFVPWDLEGCRASGLEGRRNRTLKVAARTSGAGAI